MQPTDIGPHPDAPDYYFGMGKPKKWDDKDCGTLMVRHVGATTEMLEEPAVRVVHSLLPSGEAVYPAYLSEWTFSPEEKLLIAAGKPLRILVSGAGMPPIAAWVAGMGEV